MRKQGLDYAERFEIFCEYTCGMSIEEVAKKHDIGPATTEMVIRLMRYRLFNESPDWESMITGK